jgi:WD40 repeat protein
MKQVSSFLQVEQRPDAVLLAINEKQHHGSCQWLTTDESFQQWVSDSDNRAYDGLFRRVPYTDEEDARILWLRGRPGTGKSVASGHVVRYLEACNLDCSFYFFRHNDKPGSTISAMLQSLAFQMAESSYEVRRTIVAMIEDGVRVSHGDHHMLWSKLFVDRIFRLESLKRQFWVIDAVDECSGNGVPALVAMLSKLDHTAPLRVFLTSRPGGQLERLLMQERVRFDELSTGRSGSLRDIEGFLQARCPQLRDTESYQTFLSDVLSKSNGIFLWASLIVARLENIFTVEDMQETLQTIPSEMDGFYSRIADSILASPSCDLASCILKWVICAPRPLTTGELAEAVKLDIDRTLTASSGQLETITGHLIFVDSQSRVHVTHETTSSFLTRRREGLWIDRPMAHSKLAEVCLATLCGAEFAPPRTRRGAGPMAKKSASPLASYAAVNFGYHLMHSSSAVDALLIQLNNFLRSNVLTWIERLAESGNLSVLQQTSYRLKAYLARRAEYHPPASVEVPTVSAWVNDIHHLVAAFHSGLLASPSSIHFIIPHFCPPTSIIRQLFAKTTKRLRITGLMDEDWSDRLTSYLFSGEVTSVACCERLLAVGLKTGDITTYDTAGFGTFESVGVLVHGKKVRQLAFDPSSSLLASCSVRKLMLWDVRRSSGPSFPCLWARDLDFTPDQVLFNRAGSLIMLSDPGRSALTSFSARSGTRNDALLLHPSQDSDSSDSEERPGSWAAAEHIQVDSDRKLAALAYRNSLVSIWDLEAVEKIGNFEREGHEGVYSSPPALDMEFNPVPELELLAISYKDGDVVLCNPWTLEQIGKCHLPYSLVLLTCTSDGRVLAGGAEDGMIHLLLFETLQPLYRIQPSDERSRLCDLAFSANNLRLFEIRGQSCNVWEPLVLVPKDRSDDSSSEPQSEEVAPQEPGSAFAHAFQWRQAITIIQPTERGLLFVGRQDGTVDICDGNTGETTKKLRLHVGFARIKQLGWNDTKSLLLSVDAHNRCVVTRLTFTPHDKEPQATAVLDHREPDIVRQALLSPDAASILVRTGSGLKLIAVDGGSVLADLESQATFCSSHPSNSSLFIAYGVNSIHLFDWASLKRLSPEEGIPVTGFDPSPNPLSLNGAWFGRSGSAYLAQCTESSRHQTTCFLAFDGPKLTIDSREVDLQVYIPHKLHVRTVIGVVKSTLYFLDTKGWVSSIGLKSLRLATHYTRHFFIPPTWHMGGDVVIGMVSKTAVAFARGEQVIVFHGFLEFEEKVLLGEEKALVLREQGVI